jgi:hypothetical protein
MNILIPTTSIEKIRQSLVRKTGLLVFLSLVLISIVSFTVYLQNGLGLSYNDARSHLDIGRRVVEGLKPGLAQLGSVWLPLTHLLMVPTIWNDFMWHTGLAGALQSMIAFVVTGMLIFKFLERINVGILGRLIGVFIFVANINVLYLQSTAMTELLLLAFMTAGCYYLLLWHQKDSLVDLIKSSFFIMLSSLIRYDGWFLLVMAAGLVVIQTFRKKGYKATEGTTLIFLTMGGVGIVLWFLWNLLIFKDPLYFMFGPFSAYVQQRQLLEAGVLATKGNLLLSTKIYFYAFMYNAYTIPAIIAFFGAISFWTDKKYSSSVRFASSALIAPLIFNILALYLGHSVLFVQGLSGNTWFNVRYGMMLMPTIAIFVGYLMERAKSIRPTLIGILMFITFFAFANQDAVTIDDARVGSSQKNVTEVSGWLYKNANGQKGFILISAASHDAIIFSSGLPMKRFIHEGTGLYWDAATQVPDKWARWIIMRTHDDNDLTWKFVSRSKGFDRFVKVGAYPFADIYELKPEFLPELTTDPVFGKQK